MDLSKVERIAHEVRTQLDIWWPAQHSCNTTDLCGCCVIGSTKLMLELQKQGFDCQVAITECHGFVEIGKYVVDVTATQFNFTEQVLIKPKSFFAKNFSNSLIKMAYSNADKQTFKSFDEVARHQISTGWIEEQSVVTFEDFVKGSDFNPAESWGVSAWDQYCSQNF